MAGLKNSMTLELKSDNVKKEQLITIFGNGTNKRDYIFWRMRLMALSGE